MPFQGLDERVDRLEAVLTSFIAESRQFVVESRQLTAEMRQEVAEMKQWRVQAQKQWGEIAQKMGSFVEDIVAPNIPHIGQEMFKIGEANNPVLSGPRLRIRHPADPSRGREFDYVYIGTKGWIVVESKKEPKLNDVDSFRAVLAEVKEYFPEHALSPLFPIFASLYVPEHVVNYCTRHGIYALGMGPETMQLLNVKEMPAHGSVE